MADEIRKMNELSDEQLMDIVGGYDNIASAHPIDPKPQPYYGIIMKYGVQPLYGIIVTKYGVQPLYGVKPIDVVQPLYGIKVQE